MLLDTSRHSLQNTPILFHNVTCNETESVLLQCVDLHTIGVYICDGNTAAGVSCPNVNSLHNMTAKLTTELLNMESLTSSTSIHAAVIGSTAAVTIGIIVVVVVAAMIAITLKMKMRRYAGLITYCYGWEYASLDKVLNLGNLWDRERFSTHLHKILP